MEGAPLRLETVDDAAMGVRRWRLVRVSDGRIRREWATAIHSTAAHPLLSWRNTVHSQLELSCQVDEFDEFEGSASDEMEVVDGMEGGLIAADDGAAFRAVANREKPYAKEIIAGGDRWARQQAISLLRIALSAARRQKTPLIASAALLVSDDGSRQVSPTPTPNPAPTPAPQPPRPRPPTHPPLPTHPPIPFSSMVTRHHSFAS